MQVERGMVVYRFEVVFAPDGDALVCFVGRVRIDPEADATLNGRDLVVFRGGFPPVRFVDLTDRDVARLASAPGILINRSFEPHEDELSQIRLVA